MNELVNRFKTIKRELLELKTAQTKPSIMATYVAQVAIPAISGYAGPKTYTINYDTSLISDDPITYTDAFALARGVGVLLRPYNENTNKQDILVGYNSSATTLKIVSTRKILSITEGSQMPAPSYPLISQWRQVRDFYPADMGTAVGYCLQNCRLGFHIYSGTYPSAKADADAQQANGTLHADLYPPNYLAVPIYIDNGNWDGHVGVWDHGTFYSDGYIINDYVSYYGAANIRGWGEFCDGARVVEHV